MGEALAARLDFVRELDGLKGVERRTRILDGSRLENTAEHSWHLAMMAMTLAPESNQAIDTTRVVELLLCHDIVEIDADDTFVYDLAGRASKAEREREAADRIFALLPGDEGARLRSRWEEYESGTTAEAWFARAIDRFQPLLLNMGTGGGSWKEHGIRVDQVLTVNRGIAAGSLSIWEHAQDLVGQAHANGWLQPAATGRRDDAPGLPPFLVTDRLRLFWPRLGQADGLRGVQGVRVPNLKVLLPRLGRGEGAVWLVEVGGHVIGSVTVDIAPTHVTIDATVADDADGSHRQEVVDAVVAAVPGDRLVQVRG